MLKDACEKKLFDGELTCKVLLPEDIIGLKVQAMINDPQRQKQEMLDIESLLTLENYSVNWKKLEEYFQLFELTDDFNMLKKRYQNA